MGVPGPGRVLVLISSWIDKLGLWLPVMGGEVTPLRMRLEGVVYDVARPRLVDSALVRCCGCGLSGFRVVCQRV